jgi:riboflavin biosynthesis pyrimidine reductase
VTVLASELADEHALNQMPDGVEVRRWESGDGLVGAFRILAESGVGELLVEPGTRLLSAMWESECLDRFVAVSAGGMGGDSAQTLYVGEADRDGERLVRRTFPLEAGIVGDVSVTVWSRCGGFDEA